MDSAQQGVDDHVLWEKLKTSLHLISAPAQGLKPEQYNSSLPQVCE